MTKLLLFISEARSKGKVNTGLVDALGCKFRQNSDQNYRIPLRLGDFAPGTTEFSKCSFRFSPVFLKVNLTDVTVIQAKISWNY